MTHITDMISDGMIYVRHQISDPIADVPQRRFGPLQDPSGVCVACQTAFLPGQYQVLVPIGPGDDEEAQEKAKAGRWFNAVAVAIHDTCSGGVFE